MKLYLKQGWRLTVKHLYIVILLFLYELIWGFFLYRIVDHIVVPLLRRYPGSLPSADAAQIFLTEAQFQLLKTDLIRPYIWLFAGLLAARMLVTPLLNAGLLHSLRHAADEEGTHFLRGIRAAWKPVALLYLIETALALSPAGWLLPRALDALLSSGSAAELAQRTLPWAAGWLAWAAVLHLLFLAMQFGAVSRTGILKGLGNGIRRLLPLVGISLLLWLIGASLSLTFAAASMLWAGLIALILQQSYHLVRTIMKVWTVASQLDVWKSKQT
ncbi:hypothetical protein [Paenibacillus humicola]|uniref:hypothetical protein n=1 Tax=Paenibacillus humicola TaxID=3110540 RepID=UPI00237B1290|nr:hypothetical protein [Paenibacillus humicola]